jgi:tetratricopeptide (TPR) repeat protein
MWATARPTTNSSPAVIPTPRARAWATKSGARQWFKRSGRPVDEIGRELGVAYVVEGSVRQAGDRVRITAQLVHATDQTNVWTDTYDGDLADCLTLQAQVARRIARTLAIELLPATGGGTAPCCTANVEAYRAYRKGRFHWNTSGAAGSQRALAHYDAALALDPEFARAHAAVAHAKARLVEYEDLPADTGLREAAASATPALDLDPSLSWGHLALTAVRTGLEWNWPAAESHYQQALRLSPNCEAVHYLYARFLAAMHRPQEALALAAQA